MKSFSARTFILILIAFFSLPKGAQAQIPIEVMAGNNQVQYQAYFFKNLDQGQRWNLFGMSRFAKDYENDLFNNSLISSQLTYSFTPSWGISGGASYTQNDLNPLLALSYTKFNKKGDFFLNLFPSVILNKEISFELSGIMIYSPKLTENLNLFSQVIFASSFNKNLDQHLFSNQQVRLGLGVKDWFQTGIGFDNTMIGALNPGGEGFSQSLNFQNVGIFLRKDL